MFNWTDEEKEVYYRKAERIVRRFNRAHKTQVSIDRDRFAIRIGSTVRVFIKPIIKCSNKKLIGKLSGLEGFNPIVPKEKHNCLAEKPIFFNGAFEFRLIIK